MPDLGRVAVLQHMGWEQLRALDYGSTSCLTLQSGSLPLQEALGLTLFEKDLTAGAMVSLRLALALLYLSDMAQPPLDTSAISL